MFLSYAALIEPFSLKVTTWTVTTGKWTYPRQLRIVILTDLHMMKPWMTAGHLDDIVQATNKLDPDVVLLLGDYAGATRHFGWPVDPDEGLAPLKKLTSVCGAYAVVGNHDIHPPSHWMDAMARTGIPVLKNQALSVRCHGQEFWLAGLEDLWWQHPNLDKTLAQATDKKPVIMMMHNPDLFAEMPGRVALSVAGHMHGGQVKLPFIGAVTAVLPSNFGQRYLYGHIFENGKDLVVSSGLGMTGLPLRFMTPPEITVVLLKNKNHYE
ncbi:MAG: metallophosphoesterase [Micavibrio sp.]|nr:metallophosphoesterase [Micavibrio sp.]